VFYSKTIHNQLDLYNYESLIILFQLIKTFYLCLFSFIFFYTCETYENFQNSISTFDRNHRFISLKLMIEKQLKRTSYGAHFVVISVCWIPTVQRIWKRSDPALVTAPETVRYGSYPVILINYRIRRQEPWRKR